MFLSGVASGMAKGTVSKIRGHEDRSKQDELVKERTRREEMFGINKTRAETTNEMLELQLKETNKKIAIQDQEVNKEKAYKYISAYNRRVDKNDVSSLNNLVQQSKPASASLGKLYDEEKGLPIVRMAPLTVADGHLMPREMQEQGIEINPNRMVKGITQDGREVFMDLAEYNTINGFQKQMNKDEQDELNSKYELRTNRAKMLQEEFKAYNPEVDEPDLSRSAKKARDYALTKGPVGSDEYNEAYAIGMEEALFSDKEQLRAEAAPFKDAAFDNVQNNTMPTGVDLAKTLSKAKDLGLYKDKDTTKDKILGGINVTREAGKLATEVGKMSNEELSKGIKDQGIKAIATYFSDDDFTKLPKEEREKILKSIKFESKIGNLVAQYIKSISGSAVAEQEYARLSNLFGVDKLKNIQTMKAALGGWRDSMNTEVNLQIENSKGQNPFDYMYYRNEMDKGSKKTMPTKDDVAKMSPEERKQFIRDFQAGVYK